MENIKYDEIFLPVIIDNVITDYVVSNYGTVKNITSGKILRHAITRCGYHFVTLYVNRTRNYKRVHRLVASAFIENPYGKPTVNHIDGDKDNNTVWNLEWATSAEQNVHAYSIGLMRARKGSESHYAKINETVAHEICLLLSQGKSKNYISSKLNVSKSIIKHILQKDSWVDVSSKYDIDANSVERSNARDSNKYTILNESLVFDILSMRDSGLSYRDIADNLGSNITKDSVRDVCRGKTWKDISKKYYDIKNKEEGSTTIESNNVYYTIDIDL